MTLYDTTADLTGKALRGLGLSPEDAAKRAGLSTQQLDSFLAENFSADTARAIAPVLGLDTTALAAHPDYRPSTTPPPQLSQLVLPFDDEEVNAWLLQKDGVALVIDAGCGSHDLAKALEQHGISRCHLLLTHSHRDHLGGISEVGERLISLHAPEALPGIQTTVLQPGDKLSLGPFEIEAYDLIGHHPHALGYHIGGLGTPLTAVGDAVFAGSIGGCPNPAAFTDARRTITQSILCLPPETLILTGHGPLTTLAAERQSNPFLAAW